MNIHRCRDRADYFALFHSPEFAVRWQLERHLAALYRRAPFALAGVCEVCKRAVDFTGDYANAWHSPEGLAVPNWRECLRCPWCRMNGRQRFMARLLAQAIEQRQSDTFVVYMMEVVSPVYDWIRSTFPQLQLVGSEYFGPTTTPGSVVRGIRHEDAERLSFRDASIDLLVSCDVFEHVNDPQQALREVHRVLRTGGRALMTFPMDPSLERNRPRASVDAGTLRLLEPAVYHGNPLSPKGSLVFTDFGWEVLSQMGESRLDDPTMNVYWSYELGYLGIQYYFEAGKP